MVHRFLRRGFKFWSSLGILMGAITLSLCLTSIFVIQTVRSEGVMREIWSAVLLLSVVVIWGISLAEIWSVVAKDKFLFEEEIHSLTFRHPKGFRIARLWFFSFMWMVGVTLFAYLCLLPDQSDRNFMVIVVGGLFDASIIWYAVRKTRRILRRRWSTLHGYE